MKRYEKYKDSGIEWIGKIPEHWTIKKLKFIAKICNGKDQKEVLDDGGTFPVYGSGGVFGKANRYIYDKPSVLLGRKGTIDKPQYVTEPFWTVDTAYFTKVNRIYSIRYFYYLCTTINFELYKYGSAVPSMTQGTLNEIKFSLPSSLTEQETLANFLDTKAAEIDSFITKKKKLISFLKEERTAIINKAVSKGIDPNAKYKESGVEWIGEIPKHWESWKLNHAFRQIGSGTTPESGNPLYHENGTINWLNTGDLNDGLLTSCGKKITEKALEDYSALKIFPAGCLVMAMYGATIGKTSIVNFETTTNQACCVFGKSSVIDLLFLQYWFSGNKEQIINLAIGGGQPNISQAILKDVRVFCPTISEQKEIVNYLDSKTNEVDSVISKTEKEIALIKEYKSALINDIVTGKIDVRDAIKQNQDKLQEAHQ